MNLPPISWLDLFAVPFLAVAFVESTKARERKEARKEEDEKSRKMIESLTHARTKMIETGLWDQAQQDRYDQVLDLEAAKAFLEWFSPNTLKVSFVLSAISFYFGITAVVGCAVGFWISSPRAFGYTIVLWHRVFGRAKGPNSR